MDFGEIIKQIIDTDISQPDRKNKLTYKEWIDDDGRFCLKFQSGRYREATIEVSVSYTGDEQEKNNARIFMLSMAFNAAIYGLKRMKNKPHKI